MEISTILSAFLKRVTGPELNYELETILSSINTLLFYKNKLMVGVTWICTVMLQDKEYSCEPLGFPEHSDDSLSSYHFVS